MRLPHKTALFGLAIAAFASVAHASEGGSDAPVPVIQKDRAFGVDHVTIAAGDSIAFRNEDEFNHQVYVASSAFGFESDEHEPGTILLQKFPVRGHFTALCHIHPLMHLDVTVR